MTVDCRCTSEPAQLDNLPEIGKGVRICGWCRAMFDPSGDIILDKVVGEFAEPHQPHEEAVTIWGKF